MDFAIFITILLLASARNLFAQTVIKLVLTVVIRNEKILLLF